MTSTHYDTIGLYSLQWFLPNTKVTLFHGNREEPDSRFVLAGEDWPRRARACGRRRSGAAVGRDQVLWRVPRRRGRVAWRARLRPRPRGLRRLRGHLDDRLYRTGYYLIIGTGITSLLGVAFWALAARSYSAHEVGQNAAAISAMTLVSGVCSLGLSAVLVRYLPIAGTAAEAARRRQLRADRRALARLRGARRGDQRRLVPHPRLPPGAGLADRLHPGDRGDDDLHPPGQRPHRPADGALDPARELALRGDEAGAAGGAGGAAADRRPVRRLERAAAAGDHRRQLADLPPPDPERPLGRLARPPQGDPDGGRQLRRQPLRPGREHVPADPRRQPGRRRRGGLLLRPLDDLPLAAAGRAQRHHLADRRGGAGHAAAAAALRARRWPTRCGWSRRWRR